MDNFSSSSLILRGIFWIVGVLVCISVGFGMVSGTLPIWILPSMITGIAGWVVIILTLLAIVVSLLNYRNH